MVVDDDNVVSLCHTIVSLWWVVVNHQLHASWSSSWRPPTTPTTTGRRRRGRDDTSRSHPIYQSCASFNDDDDDSLPLDVVEVVRGGGGEYCRRLAWTRRWSVQGGWGVQRLVSRL